LLRTLDFASDEEAIKVWSKIHLSPIELSQYLYVIYLQLQTKNGRRHLMEKVEHLEPYNDYLEMLALICIGDKYSDNKSYGFSILARGKNKQNLKRIEACLTSRDKKTRIESERCSMAIEFGEEFKKFIPREKKPWYRRLLKDLD